MIMANYNPNLVKIHRNYTYEELALVFGIHKNTVATWVKNGLFSFQDRRPFLIKGDDAKEFLQHQRASRKQKCKQNEFYCLRCKTPAKPYDDFVEYVPITNTKGRLTGFCDCCESIINKFVSYASVEGYSSFFKIEESKGLEHIKDTDNPLLNSDLTR
jgi:hypothetical protein